MCINCFLGSRSQSLFALGLVIYSHFVIVNAGLGGGGLLPKDKLLKSFKYHQIGTELGSDIIDKAEESLRSWVTTETDFLAPQEYAGVLNVFRDLSIGLTVSSFGGFPQAERKRVFFERAVEGLEDLQDGAQSFAWESDIDSYIAALKIEGNFMLDKASVQDFETSLLSADASIKKGHIGDIIIVGEKGAHVLCCPHVCETICQKLKQLRSVPVRANRIDLKDLAVKPLQVKEMTCVEASMRLDAVASASFGISRSRVVKLVEQGQVSVEFKPMLNPAYNLLAGQTVSVRGSGKCVINEVGETSKGRWRIKLTKIT